MPEAMSAVATDPDILLAAEGLSVRENVRSLQFPGARVAGAYRLLAGSVVMLPGRLLASIGKYVIVDTDFSAADGDQELTLGEDGVRITFDVPSVLSRASGSVEVHYRVPLDAAVLGAVPALACPVTLSHAVEVLIDPWRGEYSGGMPKTG